MLDDSLVYQWTPSFVFKAMGVKIPLEYILKDAKDHIASSQSWLSTIFSFFLSLLSYALLVFFFHNNFRVPFSLS